MFFTCIIVFIYALCMAGAPVYARDGIGGFDGTGISSGEVYKLTALDFKDYTIIDGDPVVLKGSQLVKGRMYLDFQEYTFVTGEPVLLKGTLIISKTEIAVGTLTIYEYKLNNFARGVQLTREIHFETTVAPKENGQTVTQTVLAREPAEKIIFRNQTYTLRQMDFTRTSLIDAKPAVNYYSGNNWYKKHYEVGGGSSPTDSGVYLVVEATGVFYGFDQYWGAADFEDTEYVIEYTQGAASAEYGDERERWSGAANVRRSQNTVTQLRYVDNGPDAISFRGGFLETAQNHNEFEYSALLPEFDADGAATGRLKRYTDSSRLERFPMTKRLVSPDLRQVWGHWSEESILKLFGLEIFKARPREFIPDQYITRAEFAAALVAAAPPVPPDPGIKLKNVSKPRNSGKKGPATSFTDVPASHEYYAQIEDAFARRLMNPVDKNEFRPNDKILVADAAVAFIRALGLESVASAHGALTEFYDDDAIPAYARDALYVAQKIGLLRGDQSGGINPKKELTKAEAAVMLDRLVEYMRADLQRDYREHLMDY